jgi:GT2 family glycosyltransferase
VKVTALLVSHDGARWLPPVLDGLARQTRRPDQVVAVDTGSGDGSDDLLRERLGFDAVVPAPAGSGFGAAVRTVLDRLPPATDDEWVWILHDDSAPAPDALEQLVATYHANPSVSVLGPKLREWPSLRRLLEVGVTISGTGRRETGLERGEYDQGQHDAVRDVLAVNSAGMLVRRELLAELGFDPRLPHFGNDLDFGWRAARAGHRTLVVPDAVVFHAEAAHRGLRSTTLSGRSRRAERRAALYTLLVNGSLLALPFQAVRLFLGSLLRALGLLLVRAPREAYDELVGVAATYLRPDRIVAGRLARRRTAKVSAREVRHLLPPPWLPYRHGLDFVTDIAAAVVLQAEDVSARRARRQAEHETGPVPAEAQNLPEDSGLIARLLASPTAWVFAVLVALSLVGMRGVLGSGNLSGGALLPAPDSAGSWWRVYVETWHEVGVGSAVPAGPYLLPLALAGTVLLGKAWLLVDLMFLFVVPLAGLGAYRFLRRLTGARAAALWGAVAYGLLPVLSGAVNQGRLGTVVAALLLPWVAHAALFLSPHHSRDRRWRAAWRSALLLSLLAAFAPLAWLLAVVLVGLGVMLGGRAWRTREAWGPLALAVGGVPVLLLPWSVATLAGRGPVSYLTEAGLPAPELLGPLGPLDAVAGHADAVGAAPAWLTLGLALAAVAALVRTDTRRQVLGAWVVLALALVAVAVLTRVTLELPGTAGDQQLWLGFPFLVAQAAAVTAATLAGTDIWQRLSGSSFGWRQPLGLLVVAVAVLSPVAGLVWWALDGVSGPLDRRAIDTVPAYMVTAAESDVANGVLVVRGNSRAGLDYLVLRDDGLRTGDDTVAPTDRDQTSLTRLVAGLATTAEAEDVERLARHGIAFVYAPPPADPALTGSLDSASGLSPASAVRPGSRAWQLEASPTLQALDRDPDPLRPWLVGVQMVLVVVAAVLAAPSRRMRR